MKGKILFNGNLGGPLLERVAPFVRASAPERNPRVLLVTAAWGAGEYNEGPVKAALNANGVPSDWVDGHDRNIRNLCAWHVWMSFLARRPEIAAVVAEIEEVSEALRGFYLEKTAFFADQIRRGILAAHHRDPEFALGKLTERDPVSPEGVLSGSRLFTRAIGHELVASINSLVHNDERMLSALEEAAEQILARTGLRTDPEWRAERAKLEDRILDSDAILLFGGSPSKLLAPLRFFDLRPALLEALRRGAHFVATSAGALVLCERIIIYDNFSGDRLQRDFHLLDAGLGLVGGFQILPHCMDRIQTEDRDNLAYLARRFSTRICAGLNEESFLLVELEGPTATSVGFRDGVHVFGPDGLKIRYHRGERIPLL